jgi:hypothetical protein
MRARVVSSPNTPALPVAGLSSVVRMRMVVVLPAPLGPSRPNTSPGVMAKVTSSRATTWPNR